MAATSRRRTIEQKPPETRIMINEYNMAVAAAEQRLEAPDGLAAAELTRDRETVKMTYQEWMEHIQAELADNLCAHRGLPIEDYKDQNHVAFIKAHVPSMVRREDLEPSVTIPVLYEQRDLETILQAKDKHKAELMELYHAFRRKYQYQEHRKELKEQSHSMLAKNQDVVEQSRALERRNIHRSSFAEAMFTNDDSARRAQTYKNLLHFDNSQEQGAEEDIDDELDVLDTKQVGEHAVLHQGDLYRNVSKYSEEYEFHKKPMKSPLMTFLMMIENSKAARAPRSFGLAHRRRHDEINIRSFYIPADYIDPLAKGLKLSANLRRLDLARTQLTLEHVSKIVNNIPFGLQYLNLSFNQNLGPEGADELRDVVLEDVRYQLDSLVLEDCRLGDEGATILGQALRLNDKLRFLDMSNNGITGKGAEEFCERLTESYLRVVFMHWNPLGSRGGQAFARALKTNSDLQVLDLSFCGMG